MPGAAHLQSPCRASGRPSPGLASRMALIAGTISLVGEAVGGGELVDDLERAGDPLGGVDEGRDDGDVAAQFAGGRSP